jgi:hypothetical protein
LPSARPPTDPLPGEGRGLKTNAALAPLAGRGRFSSLFNPRPSRERVASIASRVRVSVSRRVKLPALPEDTDPASISIGCVALPHGFAGPLTGSLQRAWLGCETGSKRMVPKVYYQRSLTRIAVGCKVHINDSANPVRLGEGEGAAPSKSGSIPLFTNPPDFSTPRPSIFLHRSVPKDLFSSIKLFSALAPPNAPQAPSATTVGAPACPGTFSRAPAAILPPITLLGYLASYSYGAGRRRPLAAPALAALVVSNLKSTTWLKMRGILKNSIKNHHFLKRSWELIENK